MNGVLPILEWTGRHIALWSWQIVLLFAIARLAVAMDLKHRPVFRTRIWTVALICFLLLPLVPAVVASRTWAREVRQAFPDTEMLPFLDEASPPQIPQTESLSLPKPERSGMRLSLSIPFLFRLLGIIWFAGTGFALIRKIGVYLQLRRLSSVARLDSLDGLAPGSNWGWIGEPSPRIRLSPAVVTPMIYGWFQPLILLPEDIEEWSTPDQRAAMLRHECVHIRRKDHWVAWLEVMVRAAFFFHPLAQSVCRRLDVERELSCDDEVLLLGSDAGCYAETILKVAERVIRSRRIACDGVFFASADMLDRRIDMLFRTRPSMTWNGLTLIPVSGMLAFLFVFGLLQIPLAHILPEAIRFPDLSISIGAGFMPAQRAAATISTELLIPRRITKLPPWIPPTVVEPQAASESPLPNSELMKAIEDGRRMNSGQAQALEKQLERFPDSLKDRVQLLAFYQPFANHTDPEDAEVWRKQVLWLIENHPDLSPSAMVQVAYLSVWDPAFEDARQLWLTQAAKHKDVPSVLFNAAKFFAGSDMATSEQLYEQGEALTPNDGLWANQLGNLYFVPESGSSAEQRAARYAKAVEAYERYYGAHPELLPDDSTARLIESAYEAGMPDKVEHYAQVALQGANANSIYAANWILGEMALQKGDVALAESYLMESVKTRGSSLLYANGPRMRLAVDLLKLGEVNFVTAYLNQCATFWKAGQSKLTRWSVLIANGIIPSDMDAR